MYVKFYKSFCKNSANPLRKCKIKIQLILCERYVHYYGWGGIICAPCSTSRDTNQLHVLAGPVITDKTHPDFVGAEKATNNAGELIALEKMLTGVTQVAQKGDKVEVQSDSILAILAAIRAQPSRKNGGTRRVSMKRDPNSRLKERVRSAFIRARRKIGAHRLQIRKVKGHSNQLWNEIADELAAIGRSTAPPYHTPPASTSQLHDRIQRALDDIGGGELESCEGIDLTG